MTDAAPATAIILAAGEGLRLGAGEPKAFLSVGGPSMLELSMRAAAACPRVGQIIVITPDGMSESVELVAGLDVPVQGVVGGATRRESVVAALEALSGMGTGDDGLSESDVVVIHDAARPFASSQLFGLVIAALDGPDATGDGAIPVMPITDTVKHVEDGVVVTTQSRATLFLVQTPQAFRLGSLQAAHEQAARAQLEVTDDAQALEAAGYRVVTVPGEPDNLKITTPTDLARAEAIVATGGALR